MKKIANTFVTIADDCGALQGTPPPERPGKDPTLARLHYDLLSQHPYEYDLDGFNFEIYCQKNRIKPEDRESHRESFFSKGHPCMRGSPLTKTYGFGAHYNGSGKIAIYPVDSEAYGKFLNDPENKVEMAMRSKRPGKSASTQPASHHPSRRPHTHNPAA